MYYRKATFKLHAWGPTVLSSALTRYAWVPGMPFDKSRIVGHATLCPWSIPVHAVARPLDKWTWSIPLHFFWWKTGSRDMEFIKNLNAYCEPLNLSSKLSDRIQFLMIYFHVRRTARTVAESRCWSNYTQCSLPMLIFPSYLTYLTNTGTRHTQTIC